MARALKTSWPYGHAPLDALVSDLQPRVKLGERILGVWVQNIFCTHVQILTVDSIKATIRRCLINESHR